MNCGPGGLAGWMIGMQMVERPWGVAAYGAASVKAMPDLVRVVSAAVILGFAIIHD